MKRWIGWSVAMCVLVGGVLGLPAPARAWQAFAKITLSTGAVIEGDSTVKGFEKQIVIVGLGNQMSRAIAVESGGGIAVGKLDLGALHFVKAFDIASPRLLTAIANAQSLSKVEITLFKTTTTGTSVPGFKITLTNALVTNMETIYDPAATPSALEKVELFYQKLQWTDLITGAIGSTP
jgi:type VI secretion system secreted protein Hcp